MQLPGRVLRYAALAVLTACGAHQSAPVPARSAAAGSPTGMPVAAAHFTPSSDGVSIAWRQYGQGETAVLLIHGWATDSGIWRAQLSALSAHHCVVTLDLAGQGASGAHRQEWTLPRFAQDVAAVAAKLPNAHLVLVGDGLRGPVALEAAPLLGARLLGVIGVETFRTMGLGPPPADRALAELAALNRLDYAAVLPAVKVPIVVIDSDLGGAVDAPRLQHASGQVQVITLQGADSFAMLDDPQRFNATLLQALASLAAR